MVDSLIIFQSMIFASSLVRGLWKTQNGATITSMSFRLCLVLLILPVMSWGGCGGGSSPKCIAGASSACACLGQQTGVHVCTSSGSYGTCVCGATPMADANAGDTVASWLDAAAAGGSVGAAK